MKNIHKIIESPTEIKDKCSWWYNTTTGETLRWNGTIWEEIDTSSYITDAYTKAESDDKFETIENVADLLDNKADWADTLAGYGIPDTPLDNKMYGRKNRNWEEIDTSGGTSGATIKIAWLALVNLRDSGQLVPGQSYRITDYITTTTQTDTQSAGNQFDVIVTALDEGVLSENASATYHEDDTYFSSNNANLESWKLKYCLDNDINKFAWADITSGKGVIYYMKDNYNNECPYDFKNIMMRDKVSNEIFGKDEDLKYYYTFSNGVNTITDGSLTNSVENNIILSYFSNGLLHLNFIINKPYIQNGVVDSYVFRGNSFLRGCNNMIFNSSVASNNYGEDCRYVFAEYYHQNNTMSNNVEYTYFGTRFSNNQSHTGALVGSSVRRYIIPDNYNNGCFLPRVNEKIYFQKFDDKGREKLMQYNWTDGATPSVSLWRDVSFVEEDLIGNEIKIDPAIRTHLIKTAVDVNTWNFDAATSIQHDTQILIIIENTGVDSITVTLPNSSQARNMYGDTTMNIAPSKTAELCLYLRQNYNSFNGGIEL